MATTGIIERAGDSDRLRARARQLLPGGVNSPSRLLPVESAGAGEPAFFLERGRGALVEDVDGRSYVDYHLCAGAAILGHRPAGLLERVCSRLASGTCFAASHRLEAEVAELVCTAMPSIEQIRFVASGSEAGYCAVELARVVTGRRRVIAFEGCYHGWITMNDVELDVLPLSDEAALEVAFGDAASPVAAAIVEPLPASQALMPLETGFLARLRELCRSYGAVLIFDEVISGFRLSRGGAQGALGVKPDLTMLGKVIGGGFPLAAYGGSADVMSCVAPVGAFYQGGTLSGHPVALEAARFVLHALADDAVYVGLDATAEIVAAGLTERAHGAADPITAVRVGSIVGLYRGPGPIRSWSQAQDASLRDFGKLHVGLRRRGVLFQPGPLKPLFVSTAHDRRCIDRTLDAFEHALV